MRDDYMLLAMRDANMYSNKDDPDHLSQSVDGCNSKSTLGNESIII